MYIYACIPARTTCVFTHRAVYVQGETRRVTLSTRTFIVFWSFSGRFWFFFFFNRYTSFRNSIARVGLKTMKKIESQTYTQPNLTGKTWRGGRVTYVGAPLNLKIVNGFFFSSTSEFRKWG